MGHSAIIIVTSRMVLSQAFEAKFSFSRHLRTPPGINSSGVRDDRLELVPFRYMPQHCSSYNLVDFSTDGQFVVIMNGRFIINNSAISVLDILGNIATLPALTSTRKARFKKLPGPINIARHII